ncbi:MAG: hypothetical protein ABI181_02565 [Mycobacteriaceae bacterium]
MSRRTSTHPIRHWTGPERKYDLIFEGTVGVVIVAVLVVAASIVFGSADGGLTYPGGPPSKAGDSFSAKYWASSPTTDDKGHTDPNGGAADFATTVVTELDGSSATAGYGPPYNNTPGASQSIAHVSLAGTAHAIFGLTQPINTAHDFVLAPLTQIVAPYNRSVATALQQYTASGGNLTEGVAADQLDSAQQTTWLKAYTAALAKGTVENGKITVARGSYGPVPALVQAELTIALNGSLDGYLRGGAAQINTNPYKATIFYSDGTLWSTVALGQGLTGDQWGVMNELWNFPGQFWLVLYAIPYHIPAIASSASADLWVGTLIVIVGMLLQLLLPWVPGLRDIPRLIPFYKIIYRKYYEKHPPQPATRAYPRAPDIAAPDHPQPSAGSTAGNRTNLHSNPP